MVSESNSVNVLSLILSVCRCQAGHFVWRGNSVIQCWKGGLVRSLCNGLFQFQVHVILIYLHSALFFFLVISAIPLMWVLLFHFPSAGLILLWFLSQSVKFICTLLFSVLFNSFQPLKCMSMSIESSARHFFHFFHFCHNYFREIASILLCDE